jgi:peptide/nickel transport system substrate-binding protein
MQIDREGRIRGLLAESAESSADRTAWTFRIREGFVWSDSRPVLPEDVRFSILLTGRFTPSSAWIQNSMIECRTFSDGRILFRFREPQPGLELEFCAYRILPRHIWEKWPDPHTRRSPGPYVGYGPFILQNADPAAGIIRFRRNPHWLGRTPFLEGFDIHVYHNPDVLSLALRKGEIDAYFHYAGSFPYAHMEGLESAGRFEFLEAGGGSLIFMAANLSRPPASDPTLRRALAAAINPSELIRLDALGRAAPPRIGFVPPDFPGAKATPRLERDLNRAGRLLDAGGYRDLDGDGLRESPDGTRLELKLITRRPYARLAELLAGQLAAAGLRMSYRAVDLPTWQSLRDRGAFDLSLSRTTPWGMRMHAGLGTGYLDSRRTGAGVIGTIRDPVFHRLCDALMSARDPEERENTAFRVQDYYADRLPVLALYQPRIYIPVSRDWTGWSVNPLYGFYNLDTFLDLRPSDSTTPRQ